MFSVCNIVYGFRRLKCFFTKFPHPSNKNGKVLIMNIIRRRRDSIKPKHFFHLVHKLVLSKYVHSFIGFIIISTRQTINAIILYTFHNIYFYSSQYTERWKVLYHWDFYVTVISQYFIFFREQCHF